MIPALNDIMNLQRELDPVFVQEHLSRMQESYFLRFDLDTIANHCKRLWSIKPDHPVELLFRQINATTFTCTVCAFDNPFVFSLISGILSSTGFDIQSGEVFTWNRSVEPVLRAQNQLSPLPKDGLKRRRIIDFFSGSLSDTLDMEQWSMSVKKRCETVFTLMEQPDSQIKARRLVNQMVTDSIAKQEWGAKATVMPTQIECDLTLPNVTRLRVISQDTPFFLYSLSTSLSLQGLFLEHVDIQTKEGRIEDIIDITTSAGKPITDSQQIDKIKFCTLLTKQFTYFLGNSPDPYAALARFETIVADIASATIHERFTEMLSEPKVLSDLARLLGTSDYLWEDFIRLNYDGLIPLLGPKIRDTKLSEPAHSVKAALELALFDSNGFGDWKKRINEFKDKQLYFIDLDNILLGNTDLYSFGIKLTELAQIIIEKAVELVWSMLTESFGEPKSIAGLPATYALAGLGKFGGKAVGYGSDLELLFVYSDNGYTSGNQQISNAQFFNLLVQKTVQLIEAKHDGLFTLDMRLRPYGNKGPLACSLESFCRYYSQNGSAHSYERLALVRLRSFAGDPELGSRIERLRDEYVYKVKSIKPIEIKQLRDKQFQEKSKSRSDNAKFSQGGLVDLEYDVMLLQVMHGSTHPKLQTPLFHDALYELGQSGILTSQESCDLTAAYEFFRKLINSLRILRNSAKDLFLPAMNTEEYYHCARRMGYRDKEGMNSVNQLHADFQMHTAHIRMFVENHFGRDTLPGPETGNIADIVLSSRLSTPTALKILRDAGFMNPQRALINVKSMSEDPSYTDLFSHIVVLASDMLKTKPDPDMALNNWERFVTRLGDRKNHYELLLFQPQRLDILLSIFSSSQWLADTLIEQPDFFDWVSSPDVLHRQQPRSYFEQQLRIRAHKAESYEQWLDAIRDFRAAETLRIGIRDICLRISIQTIMAELSSLASAVVQVSIEKIYESLHTQKLIPSGIELEILNNFCVIAFGKLGGDELNYSSDIDLLGVYILDEESQANALHAGQWNMIYSMIMERLCTALSNHTKQGYAYRVDTRLRPYGRSGTLTLSLTQLLDYYAEHAALWEVQALLKMRVIAGNLTIAEQLQEQIKPILMRGVDSRKIVSSIEYMRQLNQRSGSRYVESGIDVKNCRGGIRDIEFLAQGLQLIHAPQISALLDANTINAIYKLCTYQLLPQSVGDSLIEAYIFLRRTEHFLQLVEDRQVHCLPTNQSELIALAKRVLGTDANEEIFSDILHSQIERVKEHYQNYLLVPYQCDRK